MSIQSTVNQTFSLLALATSGSRARRKDIETAQKSIATSSITAETLRKKIEDYDEATDNEEKTLDEWGKELKGRADLLERYDTAFQREIDAKRKLFEMQPTRENYEALDKSNQKYKEQMEIKKGALEVSKLIPEMQKANANRKAFKERESQRLRSSILSATEYSPRTYDPEVNYKMKKEDN